MITVAICTHNRAGLLKQTLRKLSEAAPPLSREWELLVVNNACTDNTDAVASDFAGLLPLRLLHQPIPGLSNARNTAVDNALGEYIIWTDDDVLVDDNWLLAYEDAFNRLPDSAFFGGPVSPCFEQPPPVWLSDNWTDYASCYAVIDFGPNELRIDSASGMIPFGANYCIRRGEQLQHRYDPRLGRRPGKTILSEETVVLQSIMEKGGNGHWLPGAGVRHWIPTERLCMGYLEEYFRGSGRTRALIDPFKPNGIVFRSVPIRLLKKLLKRAIRYHFLRIFGIRTETLSAMREYEYLLGYAETAMGRQAGGRS